MPVIGFLGGSTPAAASQWVAAFSRRLREFGWVEGRNVAIESRWMEGRTERSAEIAAEFDRLWAGSIFGTALLAVLVGERSSIDELRHGARQVAASGDRHHGHRYRLAQFFGAS
jgi:putative ABC transport system substrate-binding protein